MRVAEHVNRMLFELDLSSRRHIQLPILKFDLEMSTKNKQINRQYFSIQQISYDIKNETTHTMHSIRNERTTPIW